MQIAHSVGRSGVNNANDVRVVQQLLKQRNLYTLSIDGICGRGTINGITLFQKTFMLAPDGLVEPNGATIRRLSSPPTTTTATVFTAHGLTSMVQRPARDSINAGLTAVTPDYMLRTLGRPREAFSENCQPITNPSLRNAIKTGSVGPFRVTGYGKAVDSLAAVMDDIRREQPDIYPFLGTAGMLCCRYVRGSKTAISNHSWGTAVDLKLDGRLDRRGDNLVQYGLTVIAPIFNRHRWYWGAAFRTEDAMHFEASRSLIDSWVG